ncbi:MAG TPA: phospho-sugar mutase [Candidatus Limnocylindria bacterium]|nr:phospho-sugar mutase [Candidatus Limnocylindria bacterium]
MSADLFDRAREWLAEDPDEDTRTELEALLVTGDIEEVADRFAGSLAFGTAGLRGALGAGPNRMNRAVVIRAAAGLAAYLRAHGGGSVVIGYDARHKSDIFATDTADVLAGAGLTAYVLPRPLPTPVLAFAIRNLGCAAGVMVTASHNPPQDNGYKVYVGGLQIVAPVDAEISAEIQAVGALADVPRATTWTRLGDEVLDAYLNRAASLVAPAAPRELTIAYTPLHGVGRDVVLEAFARAGFDAPHVVTAQGSPDPDFPTVAFPNPEEPGAIDLAVAAGRSFDADLVLANDPDADRCAVAVPLPDGSWRMLRGDEVGALLATHVLHRGRRGALACSIVSSSLLGEIASAAEPPLPQVETLTGFKWIARVPGLVYGYEEALGYCVDPEAVSDKDGVTAALLVAEMAAGLKAEGRSLLDVLDDLARAHGLHATDQLSVRFTDLDEIPAVMQRLRSTAARTLGGLPVLSVDDLGVGSSDLPPTDGLRYHLGSDGADVSSGRVVIRPSGTEPKIKAYLEVVLPVLAGEDDLSGVRRTAAARLAAVSRDVAAMAGFTPA